MMIKHAASNQSLPPSYQPVTQIPNRTIDAGRFTLKAGGLQHVNSYKKLDADRDNQKYQCLSSVIDDRFYNKLMQWLDESFAGKSSNKPLFSWLLQTGESPPKHIGYVEISVVDEKTLRLGCVLASGSQGQGYATDACCKVLEWAQSLPNVKVIQGLCHPKNEGSIKLMQGLGMTHQRLTPDEHVFPNYNPKGSGQEERSQMQEWSMHRDPNGAWPILPQRGGSSLNICFTNPIASDARSSHA